MNSFFNPLRKVNKVYTNPTNFNIDNLAVINTAPGGFKNVLSSTNTQALGNNRFVPGYNIGNNNFISTADMNRIMRNNDVTGIRNVFGNVSQNNLNGLTLLRRADNIPDAAIHSSNLKRNAVKQNYPNTNTTSAAGVDNVLQQNPNLNSYLQNLKTAGVVALIGTGVYLTFSAANLIQDVIEALNRTGGSYYYRGSEGGDVIDACLLIHRTCRRPETLNGVELCTIDPLISDASVLNNICQGYNYESEKTVCRASDPNANPNTPQYVDISDLAPGQTLNCVEPYNMGDLIGDLGLDGLLGENGLVAKSSNKSTSLSDSLLPFILIIGAIFLFVIIGYFVFKQLFNRQTVAVETQSTR
ncbi:ODV-E56 [Chrysodeixis includens nucleopolyhedrovirus]|uniref:ODV-E56 n=1 Tax=Chrysodeixis includens nucleopolyhedrovirus TaxID=1207438 RepID=A0A5B8YQY6_9ABAC|nr:ODV-E56 [Chrysodeixis includens nucleopolyhedrovirus]QED40535.1 ODV-E56 [Chrysodeixis includens nucleopolyhedrovirus]